VAGTIATLLIAIMAPPLAGFALRFGAPEYFSLMLLGLGASVLLASGSFLKAGAMILLGVLLGIGGHDICAGQERLTCAIRAMADGVEFAALAMGVFGLAEVIRNLGAGVEPTAPFRKVKGLWLDRSDIKAVVAPVLRGTGLGALLGV